MLKLIDGFKDSVIAIEAQGEITRKDYEEVLIPRAKKALTKYNKVDCFMYITEGSSYSLSAMATDAVFGFSHLTSWRRIAVVTNVEWMQKSFGFIMSIMPFNAKLFSEDEFADAKAWLEEADE